MDGGYYNLKENEKISIVKVQFAASMGLPGGGRTLPTKRLLRNFNILHIPPFSHDTLFRIFSKILDWGLGLINESAKNNTKLLTSLSISLYQRASLELLPLPGKTHYMFNLRSVAEVI
jgi:dynein heavy chain